MANRWLYGYGDEYISIARQNLQLKQLVVKNEEQLELPWDDIKKRGFHGQCKLFGPIKRLHVRIVNIKLRNTLSHFILTNRHLIEEELQAAKMSLTARVKLLSAISKSRAAKILPDDIDSIIGSFLGS